jgi:hypothetical protein
MRRPTSKSSDAAWAKLIREELVSGVEGRPDGEGWMSVQEFSEKRNCSISHAHVVLKRLARHRKVEFLRGRVNHRWVCFYRPV